MINLLFGAAILGPLITHVCYENEWKDSPSTDMIMLGVRREICTRKSRKRDTFTTISLSILPSVLPYFFFSVLQTHTHTYTHTHTHTHTTPPARRAFAYPNTP